MKNFLRLAFTTRDTDNSFLVSLGLGIGTGDVFRGLFMFIFLCFSFALLRVISNYLK